MAQTTAAGLIKPVRRARVVRSRLRGGRSLVATIMLACVLLSLATYTIYGNIVTTKATVAQSDALTLADALNDARTAVAAEALHVREYQAAPSTAVRTRFTGAVAATDRALQRALRASRPENVADVRQLNQKQAAYVAVATRLIDMVAASDPDQAQYDLARVTPAFYTLQHDTDKIAQRLADVAKRRVADLRKLQARMFIGTAIGFAVGFALVGLIMRMIFGYQRRLARQATANEHLALHDPLTGLPNRALFNQRLDAALGEIGLVPAQQLAVIIIDLNGFKAVNDTLGHHAGDELLNEASRRLLAAVRQEDVVARLGGDEFAVLLPRVPDAQTARDVAERVAEALCEDFGLDAGPTAVSGAVGVALGTGGVTADDLVRHADAAMYHAKNGGTPVVMYEPGHESAKPDRLTLFGDMRALLGSGDPDVQLRLYFQPQVRVADGEVVGVEALARWQHPERGLLMPAAFLPVVEHGGLEIPLTYHLLGVALDHAAAWHTAGRPMWIAVNISPHCLLDDDFVSQISTALTVRGLPPGTLKLEVTEKTAIAEPRRVISALLQLRRLGVQVSIDDFGSGFSSLSQLKRIPTDELKIDRSFIRDLVRNSDDQNLVSGAINLARSLSRSVVADGVEDLATLRLLRDMGCDYAQGYALSRPVPVDRLEAGCAEARRLAQSVLSHDEPSSDESAGECRSSILAIGQSAPR